MFGLRKRKPLALEKLETRYYQIGDELEGIERDTDLLLSGNHSLIFDDLCLKGLSEKRKELETEQTILEPYVSQI